MTASAIPDPPPAARRKAHSETSISMRISSHMLQLIDDAASLTGKSRTEFVLDSARRHAVDVLLDQRLFLLGDEQHDAFMRALDDPPLPSARLRKLMREPAPWKT